MRALSYKEYTTLLLAFESRDGRVIPWNQKTVERLIRDGFVVANHKMFITEKGRRAVTAQGSSGGRA